MDLTRGAVLETGCVYLVPLMERAKLPADIAGIANPKSSTGRLDVFTRLITDRASEFDRLPEGYDGPLYCEISPRTFSILVRPGSRLNQLRLRRGRAAFSRKELAELQAAERLIGRPEAEIGEGIALSVDLSGSGDGGLAGYRAKRHAPVIDVDLVEGYDARDFWEEIEVRDRGHIILDPNEFYILHSKETVHVPPETAAEMVPIDPLVGEFRVHYAGFFDPGFGHEAAGGQGSRAVLEVRSHEVPFVLEDGQKVGRLIYEPMAVRPARLYGETGSHYQRQGLKLSKHFRRL
jgi:dCTP deaminase